MTARPQRFEPEEVKRHITVSSAINHGEWNGHSLHIVDTPGYGDFIADTRSCLRVLGGAVVIISAISGVKVQTEEVWEWANEAEIPACFVNKWTEARQLPSGHGRYGKGLVGLSVAGDPARS
jgi:elongation factor G